MSTFFETLIAFLGYFFVACMLAAACGLFLGVVVSILKFTLWMFS